MPQFWENDKVVGQPATQAPTRQGGFIPAPGYEEEQARKSRAEAIAAEEEQRKRIAFEQDQADRNLRGGAPTSESEKTAAFLATRIANGIRDLNSIEGGVSPELLGSAVGAVFGDTAQNLVTSGPRQRVEAAQRDILDAALTLGTGMAYTAEQLEGYRFSYFPRFGDDDATIADKQNRLKTLLEAAKVKAGAAAPAIDQALAAVGGRAPQGDGNAALQSAFDRGASKQELLALAQQYGVQFPGGEARLDEVLQYRDAGGQGATFLAVAPEQPRTNPDVSAAADALEAQLGEAGIAELAKQGITLGLSDEGGAVGTVIGQALGGDFNVGDNYNFAVQVEREVLRRARERSGYAGTAAELAGGGGAIRTLGTGVASVGRAALEGAGVGGVAGFGYGEGVDGSTGGAALGAATGGALGAGLQKFLNRGATPGGGSGGPTAPTAPTTPGRQVIQAADNFNAATGANVQPLPADAGGALTRRASGAVAQTTFGAKPIVEGAQAVNAEAQAGIRALAGRQGAVPVSKQAGGEVAIKGADKIMAREKLKVDAKYAKARKEAGAARVPLPFAKTTAEQEIRTLSDTPGGTDPAGKLREIVGDLGGDYTVEGIKRFRGVIRDKLVSEGLRGSEVEAAALRIVDAADADIEDGLIALGKQGAARAYSEASKAASERFTLIDDVLAPILGRKGEKSGEQVFAAIDQLTRGDAVSLGKFMRALPAEEAGSIRGIIIDRLGRATKGRQDADGQAFSLNDFLTRWNDEGLSREAKSVLFDGETIAALDDLARVAQGTKEGQRFANFSNTGGANWLNFILNGAPLGAVAGGVVPAAAAAGTSVTAQFGLGRLLASPKFARWLAKMPKQPNQAAVKKHIMGLEKIAAADAAIASDALGLQRQLIGVFDQGAAPVTAQGQSEDSNTTGLGTR